MGVLHISSSKPLGRGRGRRTEPNRQPNRPGGQKAVSPDPPSLHPRSALYTQPTPIPSLTSSTPITPATRVAVANPTPTPSQASTTTVSTTRTTLAPPAPASTVQRTCESVAPRKPMTLKRMTEELQKGEEKEQFRKHLERILDDADDCLTRGVLYPQPDAMVQALWNRRGLTEEDKECFLFETLKLALGEPEHIRLAWLEAVAKSLLCHKPHEWICSNVTEITPPGSPSSTFEGSTNTTLCSISTTGQLVDPQQCSPISSLEGSTSTVTNNPCSVTNGERQAGKRGKRPDRPLYATPGRRQRDLATTPPSASSSL